MIREWEGVDCATVNLSEDGFEHVMSAMLEVGIGIDVGLWAPIEMDRLVGPAYFRRCSVSVSNWTQVNRISFRARRRIWRSR